MQRCINCLYYENHPFGITFKNGICSGCITHKEKYSLDWLTAENQLLELIDHKTKNNKSTYDCVIPVKGDAEDYFVVSKILKYNLKPLIIVINNYFLNEIGWYNIHNLITHFDVDSIIYNPDIDIYKEMVRTTLRKYENLYIPSHILYTSFPVHTAINKKIPLIIWGQLQSVEQTGKFSHYDKVEMSRWNRREHDLLGLELDEILGTGAQINQLKVDFYNYPHSSELKNVLGIYLSNYFLWDPLKQNNSTLKYGFKPQNNTNSFDVYERSGCSVYYKLHDLLKLKKYNYKKVTDQLVREIRHNRIELNDANRINNQYLKEEVYIDDFFEWLGVTKTGMDWFIKHKLTNYSHLIGKDNNNIKNTINIGNFLKKGEISKHSYLKYYKGI